jgi:aryl-alcohol dehydrogenase-like predicted oxidoreductase
MEHRRLGSSELNVPVVIFGAWAIGGWWWGGTDDKEAIGAIHRAIDVGVDMIDTAPIYGMGHSEEVVGKALKDRRHEVLVATKCGIRWDTTEGGFYFKTEDGKGHAYDIYHNLKPHAIRYECERSLKLLGIDIIDLYQCHRPDPTTPLEDTMGEMVRLREEGKIKSIGVSNFSADMIETSLQHALIASEQPKYSLLSREIEAELVPFCRQNNVGLIVYSPLEQGILTGKVSVDRKFPPGDLRANQPWFQPENLKRALEAVEKLKPIAADRNVTLGQLTLAWTVAQAGVTAAIVGARNAEQVEENAGAADLKLSDEEIESITGIFDEVEPPE